MCLKTSGGEIGRLPAPWLRTCVLLISKNLPLCNVSTHLRLRESLSKNGMKQQHRFFSRGTWRKIAPTRAALAKDPKIKFSPSAKSMLTACTSVRQRFLAIKKEKGGLARRRCNPATAARQAQKQRRLASWQATLLQSRFARNARQGQAQGKRGTHRFLGFAPLLRQICHCSAHLTTVCVPRMHGLQ